MLATMAAHRVGSGHQKIWFAYLEDGMSKTPHIVRWDTDPEIEGDHFLTPVTCEMERETLSARCTVLQSRVLELEMILVEAMFPMFPKGARLVEYVEDFRPDNV